ncbi:MAG: DNA mismatch repair endonuclease MutL [Pelagibacterales bacterium]|nr:DNA mismatch repair endonuclease MutL [Pelagibacterales bacterium]
MSDIIKILPTEVSNKIAAGEVVQRPASVVKELLENSIDAESTKIKLIVKDSGKTLIQVVDNGVGMTKNDMEMSFMKHATSKITAIDDVFSITSMGFRGEALASISSISNVEMISKKKGTDKTNIISLEGDKVAKEKTIFSEEGTSIKVMNLFYNVPARRNFLKSDFVELRHIIDSFSRIALSYPNIEFNLIHNDEELFYLKKSNLRKRISSILGRKIDENLIPLNEKTSLVKISGFILKPDISKKSRSNQFLFVNNRYIKSQFLNHSINNAYDGLLRDGYYPGYFIFLDINPSKIDVNVHPNKTEIKFEDEQNLYSIINSSIKHSLGIYQITPVLDFEKEPSMELPYNSQKSLIIEPSIEVDSSFNPFIKDKIIEDWEELESKIESDIFDKINNNEEIESPKIFQVFNKYIITTTGSSLILLNQSLAHQRILYEQFLKFSAENNLKSQKLIFPIEIELTTNQEIILAEIKDVINSMGFKFNINKGVVNITAIPPIISDNPIEEIFEDLLNENNSYNIKESFSLSDLVAKKLSKLLSIRSGKPLKVREQQTIINQLFSCKEPKLSPFNKQIFVTLDKKNLDKNFFNG